jgi:hypothetical protein
VSRVSKAFKVSRVFRVSRVSKDRLGLLALKVFKGLLALKVFKGLLALKVFKDFKVFRVKLVKQEPLDLQDQLEQMHR